MVGRVLMANTPQLFQDNAWVDVWVEQRERLRFWSNVTGLTSHSGFIVHGAPKMLPRRANQNRELCEGAKQPESEGNHNTKTTTTTTSSLLPWLLLVLVPPSPLFPFLAFAILYTAHTHTHTHENKKHSMAPTKRSALGSFIRRQRQQRVSTTTTSGKSTSRPTKQPSVQQPALQRSSPVKLSLSNKKNLPLSELRVDRHSKEDDPVSQLTVESPLLYLHQQAKLATGLSFDEDEEEEEDDLLAAKCAERSSLRVPPSTKPTTKSTQESPSHSNDVQLQTTTNAPTNDASSGLLQVAQPQDDNHSQKESTVPTAESPPPQQPETQHDKSLEDSDTAMTTPEKPSVPPGQHEQTKEGTVQKTSTTGPMPTPTSQTAPTPTRVETAETNKNPSTKESATNDGWACEMCTLQNSMRTRHCKACKARRPVDASSDSSLSLSPPKRRRRSKSNSASRTKRNEESVPKKRAGRRSQSPATKKRKQNASSALPKAATVQTSPACDSSSTDFDTPTKVVPTVPASNHDNTNINDHSPEMAPQPQTEMQAAPQGENTHHDKDASPEKEPAPEETSEAPAASQDESALVASLRTENTSLRQRIQDLEAELAEARSNQIVMPSGTRAMHQYAMERLFEDLKLKANESLSSMQNLFRGHYSNSSSRHHRHRREKSSGRPRCVTDNRMLRVQHPEEESEQVGAPATEGDNLSNHAATQDAGSTAHEKRGPIPPASPLQPNMLNYEQAGENPPLQSTAKASPADSMQTMDPTARLPSDKKQWASPAGRKSSQDTPLSPADSTQTMDFQFKKLGKPSRDALTQSSSKQQRSVATEPVRNTQQQQQVADETSNQSENEESDEGPLAHSQESEDGSIAASKMGPPRRKDPPLANSTNRSTVWTSTMRDKEFLNHLERTSGSFHAAPTRTLEGWISTTSRPNGHAKPSSEEPRNIWDDSQDVGYQFQEVVRNKAKRRCLPGHDCAECRAFYDCMRRAGHEFSHEMVTMEHSRHRARFAPPETPDDFWDIDFTDEKRNAATQGKPKGQAP